MKYLFAAALAHHHAGDIAGRRHAVIGVRADAELIKLANDPGGGPWRVGDQNDGTATGAVARQCVAGFRVGFQSIMDHAPNVAKNHIIARREDREASSRSTVMRGHRWQASLAGIPRGHHPGST